MGFSLCAQCGYNVPDEMDVCVQCGRDKQTGARVREPKRRERAAQAPQLDDSLYYGMSGAPRGAVRLPAFVDLRTPATVAIVGLSASFALGVLGVLVALDERRKVLDLVSHPTQAQLDQLLRDQQQLSRFVWVMNILSVLVLVPLLWWVYTAYKNLKAVGIYQTPTSPGVAVVEWIIPIISLFRPYQRLNEIWRGSEPTAPVGDPTWRERPGSMLVYAWWATVIAAIVVPFLAVFAAASAHGANLYSTLRGAYIGIIFAILLRFAGSALALATITSLTARQESRRNALRRLVAAQAAAEAQPSNT